MRSAEGIVSQAGKFCKVFLPDRERTLKTVLACMRGFHYDGCDEQKFPSAGYFPELFFRSFV
jgi:hypothetical protein